MLNQMIFNNQFIWFIGTVEDVKDPEQAGRIRVRAIPYYNDIEVEQLPWAQVLHPIQSEALDGYGIAPVGVQPRSMVLGFFLDGAFKQQPFVLGTIGNKIHMPLEAYQPIQRESIYNEPSLFSNPDYPFNRVFRTQSNHVIEIDDTQGSERISVQHNTGSSLDILSDGTIVTRSFNDNYEITINNKNVVVLQDKKEDVQGNLRIDIKGTADIFCESEVNILSNSLIKLTAPFIELNTDEALVENGSLEQIEAYDEAGNIGTREERNPQIVSATGEIFNAYPPSNPTSASVGDGGGVELSNSDSRIDPPRQFQCGGFSSTSPEILRLSSNVDEVAFRNRHHIPVSGKRWRGETYTANDIICNLGYIWEEVVKVVETEFPDVSVNSGFRSGSGRSYHDIGLACDLQMPSKSQEDSVRLANFVRDHCPFDQLAIEFTPSLGTSWVHISSISPDFARHGFQNRYRLYIWRPPSNLKVRITEERRFEYVE